MLNDGTGFKKVYIATGFTDIRREIDVLPESYVSSSISILMINYIILVL